MKQTILFLFLLLNNREIQAQYFGLNNHPFEFYSTALDYPIDDFYRVFVYDHSYPLRPSFTPFVKVYNKDQQLVKTIKLIRGMAPPGENPLFEPGRRILWPCNYWDTTTYANPKYRLSILELDTLYNFIGLHPIGQETDTSAVYGPTGIVAFSNGYVTGGKIYDPNSPIGTRTRLYKLDLNFNKLDSIDLNSRIVLQSGFAFNDKIIATTNYITSACVQGIYSYEKKLVFDTSLNIVECKMMDSLLTYQCKNAGITYNNTARLARMGRAIGLSPAKTMLIGGSYEGCALATMYDVVVNTFLDGNNQNIKTNIFSNTHINTSYTFIDYTPYSVKLPYVVSICAVGFTNQPSWPPPFYPYFFQQKSKILVNKTDTMGNVIWVRQFGGEMNYVARGIAFTSDGGCVIAGTRYDSATMFTTRISENFLLKLDSMGNYNAVDIYENGRISDGGIRCYPNPADDKIYFDIPFETGITIEIYNQLGMLVFDQSNYVNLSPLDLSRLNKGLYYYKMKSNRNNFAGKFLKE